MIAQVLPSDIYFCLYDIDLTWVWSRSPLVLSRISINLKVIANFSDQLFATHVVIKIPVPKNTAKAKIKHSFGRAKYEPEQQAIVWRVKWFPGKAECHIQADVDLMPTVRPKPWSRV